MNARVRIKPALRMINMRMHCFLLLALWAVTASCETIRPLRSVFQERIHDPSTIVSCDDGFWLYSTGDGIKSLHSKNLHDWQFGPRVFTNEPAWTQEVVPLHRDYFWAPDVIRVGGRYLLFYSVSSWGKNTSAIGLATNQSLNPASAQFNWSDQGIVVRSFATNDFNTIDPSAFLDNDGRLWLAFGSYWSGIKLIELDANTGKRIAPDSPMYSLACNNSIEAAFIHRRDTNYFLFVNWGQCCRGTNSTYEIRVGRSDKVTGPYLDRDGKDMLQGGGSLFLGSSGAFIGPGHAGIINFKNQDWLSCHFYDAESRGRAKLAIAKLRWDSSGWPAIEL